MRFFLIALLCLGCFFRLAHLDHKIYWYDEIFTSLRASGYTEAEVVQHFATSGIVRPADLQHYQQPNPERSLADTLYSLATEDNQHPPLYYGLAHYWIRWVGSSVTAMRLLPVLLSLLGLPAAYWLCQELFIKTGAFNSTLPVWLGVALVAISPLQIAYAQEARQYSLWGTLTLAMTAALLRAIRVNTISIWALYAVTMALSFYTFLLTALTVAGQGFYVFYVWLQAKSRRIWVAYLGATLAGTLAFLPWVWVLSHNLAQAQTVTSWVNDTKPIRNLVASWATIAARTFYDRGKEPLDRMVQLAILILIAYAFYDLIRRASQPVWLLIIVMTTAPVLPLILADLALGGVRSTAARFFIPALLGLQLAVTYLLSANLLSAKALQAQSKTQSKTQSPLLNSSKSLFWRWITVALCSASLYSAFVSFQAPTWWNKTHNAENLVIQEIINQAARPLLVSDAETADIIALSYRLKPDLALLIRPRCYTCHPQTADVIQIPNSLSQIAAQYSDVFLFHPRNTAEWQQSVAQQPIKFEPIPNTGEPDKLALWKMVKS
jgi:uncharacterized membrane protein